MSNVEEIARISLVNAKKCIESKNYGRAFANFLLFLKLDPNHSSDVYMEFALASKKWFEKLEQEQRLCDLFKGYDQACEMYPNHEMVLNNIGAQLFRLGYQQEAAAYIRKALMINPDYLAARCNLENICCHLVERWHFSMLNDRRRNIAYRFAIQKAIKSGYNTVLDIGTGTGILSMVCDQAGAHQVTACDDSRAMIDVARDVLAANGCQGRITLYNKHSTSLQIPDDLPKRVKLVVTETFDAGLFGEHIVSTLIHAWRNLISTTPTGTVIPCGATVYMCGIECDAVRNKSRLLYPVLQHLDLTRIQLVCTTGHVAEEPYTTENLAKIHGGYKILTNITELLRLSFCNLCELESLHKGKDWFNELYVKRPGRLDAIAVWFDLHLDDTVTIATGADTDSCWEQAIYPVSSVHRQNHLDHNNFHVRKKDILQTCFHFEQDCLRLTKCELVEQLPPLDSSSDLNSKEGYDVTGHESDHMASETGSGTSVKEYRKQCLPFRKRKVEDKQAGEGLILECDSYDQPCGTDCEHDCDTRLVDNVGNSTDLGDLRQGFLEACGMSPDFQTVQNSCFCGKYSEDSCFECLNSYEGGTSFANEDILKDETDVHIYMGKCTLSSGNEPVDLSKDTEKCTFLAEHADIEYVNDIELNRQYCGVLESFLTRSNNKKLSLLYVTPGLSFLGVQAAKMGYSAVTIATTEDHHETIQQVALTNGCKDEISVLSIADLNELEVKFDAVICDLIEPCGALRQQALEDLVYHRVTSLTEEGLVLPQEVKVHGLLIASEELENLSHVTGDDKTLGFHIADYMNVFQMQNHLDIDLSSLTYTKLSEVTELLSIDFSTLTLESGPDVLDLKVERSVEVTAPGKLTALIYWFELRLNKDTVVSTLDSRYHWAQAGIMLRDDLVVSQGQILVTKVALQNSCLDVKVVPSDCSNGHN